eukprot:2372589-Lingulodinium_polyedra.AAC.1
MLWMRPQFPCHAGNGLGFGGFCLGAWADTFRNLHAMLFAPLLAACPDIPDTHRSFPLGVGVFSLHKRPELKGTRARPRRAPTARRKIGAAAG